MNNLLFLINFVSLGLLKIIGSVIARLGSKRLAFKNLLPYKGVPLVLGAVRKLIDSKRFDEVILSTDSELIARTCMSEKIRILKRPAELSGDEVPSIPVFKHILSHFPSDIHLNYNCNFPECSLEVFDAAIDLCKKTGESLSVPFAVWAQTKECLGSYGDPFKITASRFKTEDVHPLDIHTLDDLLETHQVHQVDFDDWK